MSEVTKEKLTFKYFINNEERIRTIYVTVTDDGTKPWTEIADEAYERACAKAEELHPNAIDIEMWSE